MKTGIIYAWTFIPTGHMYIGQTIQPKIRKNQHLSAKGPGKLARAIRKHGPGKFSYEVIMEDVPECDLPEWEMYFIWLYRTWRVVNVHGYNLTMGGEGIDSASAKMRSASPEYKASRAKALAERRADPVRYAAICNKVRQYVHTPEYRAALAEGMKKRNANPEWNKRKSASLRAYYDNPDNADIIKARGRERASDPIWHENHMKKIYARQRKVRCIETGVIYDSIKIASVAYGCENSSQLCNLLHGYGRAKRFKGLHWEFVK